MNCTNCEHFESIEQAYQNTIARLNKENECLMEQLELEREISQGNSIGKTSATTMTESLEPNPVTADVDLPQE